MYAIEKSIMYVEDAYFYKKKPQVFWFFVCSTNFFLRSRHNRVELLSYKSKMTDRREQYDWMDEKNLDGCAKENMFIEENILF